MPPIEPPVWEESGALTFGPALRATRQAQGLTLRELAQTTTIRRDYLQALEDEQLDSLPEATLTRSYLRLYARELGLNPAPLLAEFDRLIRPAPPEPAVAPPDEAARPAAAPPLGTARALLIAVLLGLLLLVGVLLLRRQALAPVAVTPPVSGPAIPNPAAPNSAAPAPESPAAVPQPPQVPPTAPQGTVRLTVQSLPDGAQVYLDNRNLGPAPVRSFPVEARGQAQLRVEAAGRTPLKQTIDLRRSRNLRATLPPLGNGSGQPTPSRLTDLNTGVETVTPPVASLPAGAAASSSVAASPGVAAGQVTVRFVDSSWTRVTDGADRVLYEGIPATGSVQTFPLGVTIRTGNAGAVRISVGGRPEQAMGGAGQVVTRRY